MSAIIMDGKALAEKVKSNLAANLSKLNKQPGLGTILVGEDAGSKAYVDGKHTDCAQVGIKSIKINLPATAKTADILKAGTLENYNITGTSAAPTIVSAPESLNLRRSAVVAKAVVAN